jgi:hypothetical protein
MNRTRTPSMREAGVVREVRVLRYSRVVLISALLIVPCFWQSRIQAGDLSSHVYNAWLASQVAAGRVQGIWIARQWNNVLFDWVLTFLASHIGFAAAQRVGVAIAVLVFAWGAIRFVSRSRGNPWFVVPSVAILAYGFIFHLGFFNFYLALGICLWYLAIFLSAGWRSRLCFAPLLVLAWIAHPLPVVWALGLALYAAIAEQLGPRKQNLLLIAGIVTLLAAHFVLVVRYPCRWSMGQIFFVTGTSQLLLFDDKYVVPLILLLVLWMVLLRRLLKSQQWSHTLLDIHTRFWLLTAAAVLLVPTAIDFPQYSLPFSYVTTRLSLMAGLTLCAVLSEVELWNYEKIGLVFTAVVFFAFIFHDTREFNRMEDQVDSAVAQFPAGSRVIGLFLTRSTRIDPLAHAVDRACIGRCFSYANYEPGSRQFRLRAEAGNTVVMHDYSDIAQVERGSYKIQARDLPLFFVYSCGPVHRQVCSRELHAGDDIGVVSREP